MLCSALRQDARTDPVAVHGLDDWNDLVGTVYDNLTIDADRAGFCGVMDAREFGAIGLARVSSSPATVRRARQGNDGRPRYFKLHVQDQGSSLNVQDGQEAVLGAGDLMLCDSSRPYTIRFDDPNRMLVLRLPADRVAARLDDADALVGRRIGGEAIGGAVLAAFIRNLWATPAEDVAADYADALLDAALTLLAAAARNGPVEAAPDHGLKARIRRYIDDNLCDPDLSVGGVASALGVSPRYVQMVFAASATTPLAYIRRKRLQLAAQHLRRRGADRSITELSFSLGFNELSHFSRAFKALYGVGPREYRAG
ncbi:AraC-like ligand-binding domain-containing protein [Caulobacter sp. LARHSG274]